MRLSERIGIKRVRVPLESADKRGVIEELIDVLAETGGLRNRDAALDAVLKREAERTTGIGLGLAIPHAKSETRGGGPVVAVGKCAQPVDFQSIDGQPVTLVMLLVSPPDQTGPHILTLAKISRLITIEGFRDAAGRASTADELLAAIAAFERDDD